MSTELISCTCGREWRMPAREDGVDLNDVLPMASRLHLNNYPHHTIRAYSGMDENKFRVIVTRDSAGARTFGIRQPGCTYRFLATCRMRGHRSCSNHGTHIKALNIACLRASNARAANYTWEKK